MQLCMKGFEQLTEPLTYAILSSTLMRIETHLSLILSDKPLPYIEGGLPLRLPATSLRACPDEGKSDSSTLSCPLYDRLVLLLSNGIGNLSKHTPHQHIRQAWKIKEN